MLFTIATSHQPATDLGFLLMKNPENVHSINLPLGTATLFFPEATNERCTAAVTLEIDPVELVRGKGKIEEQYVTDRPYAVSSLMAVAMGRLLGTAMSGRSKHRQKLADRPIPLEFRIVPLPARGGVDLLRRIFEPLEYEVEVTSIALDPSHAEWGNSSYVDLSLRCTKRLADALGQINVLIPVLDNQKHYFIGTDEVEKLLRKGEGWLEQHPERELIMKRYLGGFGALVRQARAQLDELVEAEDVSEHMARDAQEEKLEKPIRLNDQRMDYVANWVRSLGAKSVLDLGCGEGRLLRELLKVPGLDRITGVEVAPKVLAAAGDRLRLETMSDIKRRRITLLQGSLVYRDDRLMGHDAAAVIEVIEHMEAERLPAFEQALFGHARPGSIMITTPNREYNILFEGMTAEALRHGDHRFEWTRAEFRHWAETVASARGYDLRLDGIGAEDPQLGHPTQVAIFTRASEPAKVTA